MMRHLRTILRAATFGMLAWAVLTELRKPREQRTWEGSLAGVVPYDLRVPTIGRIRERWWNPDDERLLTPHVFGVGWSVNLARALDLLGDRMPAEPGPLAPGDDGPPSAEARRPG
jgi:Family of unknown function (DUF5808)